MKTAPAYFHGHKKKRRIVFYPGESHANNNFTPGSRWKKASWKLLEERKWKEKEAKRRKQNATSTDYLVLANTACEKNWSESREIWMPRMSLFLIITETKRAAWRSSRKLHKLTKSIRTLYEYTFYEYLCYAKHFSKFHQYYFMGFGYYNCTAEICYRSISWYIFQFLIFAIFFFFFLNQ